MSHDSWLWMIAACTGESVILPDRLLSYRQHDNLFGDLHVGFAERLRRSQIADATTYIGQAASQETLADYLEALSRRWGDARQEGWSAEATNRATRHRALAGRAGQRAQLYQSSNRRTAVKRWAGMLQCGVYSLPSGHRAGMVSAAKDGIWSLIRGGSRSGG
jgi:hypothetical protein